MNLKNKVSAEFSMRKLLYNKKFTVPASIIMAFVLWLVIMINQNPTIDRTFTIPININLENTPVSENGMEIIGDMSDQQFTINVRGPSYILGALTADDFTAYASAATVSAPGDYNLDVTAVRTSGATDCEILNVSPKTVTVNFDYVETEVFTVKAKAEGASAAQGLIAENGAVSGTDKDTITIKGPRTVINTIDSVVAYTKVNRVLSASETFDADIILYDASGNTIDTKNLTLSATNVKVTVPISKKTTVPVKADFSNLPSGFSKDSISYSIDHDTVTVIGTPEVIDKITQVTLSPIDITKLSTTKNSFDQSPKLPDGVRLLDNIDHFTVSVNTSKYAEKSFTISNIQYTGLNSSLTASGDGASVKNVVICGPKTVINKLNQSSLYALIDLSDKAAGEHTVQVTIRSDEYDNIWQVGSYSTTVTIK